MQARLVDGRHPCLRAVVLLLCLAGCQERDPVPAEQRVAGGDPAQGEVLIARYGCGSCHAVPGVRGADGTVGPPLTRFGLRTYIAGVVPNRPDNLVRWIRNPPSIAPGTAMPDLGVGEQQARHMAAYLYTLR